MTESQKERKAIDGLRERILDALAGRSPAVFMAWNYEVPPKSVPVQELAEQFFHDLFAHEDCLKAALITALYDDSTHRAIHQRCSGLHSRADDAAAA